VKLTAADSENGRFSQKLQSALSKRNNLLNESNGKETWNEKFRDSAVIRKQNTADQFEKYLRTMTWDGAIWNREGRVWGVKTSEYLFQ
jgi:hypothetical protein